jgi:hypothetical protein
LQRSHFVFFGLFVAEGIRGRGGLLDVGAELTSAATKSSKPAIFEVWGAFQAGKRELLDVGAELTSAATKSSKNRHFRGLGRISGQETAFYQFGLPPNNVGLSFHQIVPPFRQGVLLLHQIVVSRHQVVVPPTGIALIFRQFV